MLQYSQVTWAVSLLCPCWPHYQCTWGVTLSSIPAGITLSPCSLSPCDAYDGFRWPDQGLVMDWPYWRWHEDAVANRNGCVKCKKRTPQRGLRTKCGMWLFIQQGVWEVRAHQGPQSNLFLLELEMSFCCKWRICLILSVTTLHKPFH